MTDPSAPLIPFDVCFPFFGMGDGEDQGEEEDHESESSSLLSVGLSGEFSMVRSVVKIMVPHRSLHGGTR